MVRWSYLLAFSLAIGATTVAAVKEDSKAGKILPLLSIVSFQNDVCESDDSKNGTCYTAEECANKGGDSQGSCGQGFGVCCVFSLSCGDTSSENNTYLTQSASASIASPCSYKICPLDTDIARIRFDFTTHVLAAQELGTTQDTTVTIGATIGQCLTDQFSVSGRTASPIICGTNTGYHMIVDADDSCHMATFAIGGGTTSRSWDILVTQYKKGEEDMSKGGPPGCLQYHTLDNDDIQSFAFPTSNTVTASITHLAFQEYDICIRRNANKCFICYAPYYGTPALADQGTWGIGASPSATIAQSATNSNCDTDYIEFPNGAATPGTLVAAATQTSKVCGRYFHSQDGLAAYITVCTLSVPFRVSVHFDGFEENTGAGNNADANEQRLFPGGIIGFRLSYVQGACT